MVVEQQVVRAGCNTQDKLCFVTGTLLAVFLLMHVYAVFCIMGSDVDHSNNTCMY